MKNLYFATVLGFQAARMISSISLGRPNSARDYPVWWSGSSSRWAITFGNQYCVAQRWKRFLIEIKSIPLQCNMCLAFRKHICLLRTVERIYSYNFFSNNVCNIFSVWQVAFTLSPSFMTRAEWTSYAISYCLRGRVVRWNLRFQKY